jgi:hypothetical protein
MRTILRVVTAAAVVLAAAVIAAAADARPEALALGVSPPQSKQATGMPNSMCGISPSRPTRPGSRTRIYRLTSMSPGCTGGGGIVASCGFPGGVMSIQLDIAGYHRHYYIAAAYANVYWPGHSSTDIWSYMRFVGVPMEGEGWWSAQYHHGGVNTYAWWQRLDGYGGWGTPVGTWRHWSGYDANYDWLFQIHGQCGIVFDF